MANRLRKCGHCKKMHPVDKGHVFNLSFFCSIDHAVAHSHARGVKSLAKAKEAKAKEYNQHTKALKEKARKRTGPGGYYDSLKLSLHHYVKHCLRKGEPCYTCDKPQKFEDDWRAFHVGHYMPAGAVDPRRFMLSNLRIQCYRCNCELSGNQAEYRKRLTEEMGIDHVEWLEAIVNHKPLLEQYPAVESIQAEARKYRAMTKALE